MMTGTVTSPHNKKARAQRAQPSNQSHRRAARRARRWRFQRPSAYIDSTTAKPLLLISTTLKNDKSGTLWYFAFGIVVVDLNVCAICKSLFWFEEQVWTRRGDQSCGDSLSWDKNRLWIKTRIHEEFRRRGERRPGTALPPSVTQHIYLSLCVK